MPISYCNKCLENDWSYRKVDNYTIITCNQCGEEVEITRKRRPVMKEGDPCRKSYGGRVSKYPCKFRPNKLKKAYFYTAMWRCDVCKQDYLAEEFKIKRGTKTWHEFEQRTTKEDKTANWIRLQQGSGYERYGVLEKYNQSNGKRKTYLPAV